MSFSVLDPIEEARQQEEFRKRQEQFAKTKPEETENLEKCKGAEEVDKEFYRKECKRLFEENSKMKVIIEALIEELKRRVRYD